jgi:ribosome biogenesis GTPase / thiamine phosphate phosphatase
MIQNHKLVTGKVLRVTRKTYDVFIDEEIVPCIIRGKLTLEDNEYCSVRTGDNVRVVMISDTEGAIQEILPRKSRLSRVIESREYKEHIIAANIDQIVIITSTRKPRFKSGLLDRYLIIAGKNNLNALICINKIDLANKKDFEIYIDEYSKLGYGAFFSSALTGEGVDWIRGILTDKVTLFVGHSGVGKSSLINATQPEVGLEIQQTSASTNKGLHTTSFVQLFGLSFGGFVGDTPGVRELGLWDVLKTELKTYYIEFNQYYNDCQFVDCQHINEPGCAVKGAVDSGAIFKERYRNYLNIYSSLKSAPYE